MANILVIESNMELGSLYGELLSSIGYIPSFSRQGLFIDNILAEKEWDLIVANYNLEDCDGLSLMNYLRGEGYHIPTILIVPCYLELKNCLSIFRDVILIEKPFLSQYFLVVAQRMLLAHKIIGKIKVTT